MITPYGFTYKKFKFPVGELQITVADFDASASIEFEFENNEELFELLMLAHVLMQERVNIQTLIMPYVPYSRQDRSNAKGECFSLKVFCMVINAICAKRVIITDPHSDVTTALIHNVQVIPQHEVFYPILARKGSGFLVSPDGGALKKIYKLAKDVKLPVLECSKIRNTDTGEITGVKVHTERLSGEDCYIVDDICDGGRTFVEIAKVLKEKGAGKIVLMVTHGFFTQGLKVFDGLIDEIYTRKGRVK